MDVLWCEIYEELGERLTSVHCSVGESIEMCCGCEIN